MMATPTIDYAALADKARGGSVSGGVNYAALAANARGGTAETKSRTFLDSVKDAGESFWDWTGKPVAMAIGLSDGTDSERGAKARAAQNSIIKGILNEPARVRQELTDSLDAFVAGNPRATMHHVLNAIPLVGHGIDEASQEFNRGEYAKGVGHTAAMIAPAAVQEVPKVVGAVADAAGPVVDAAKGAVKGGFKAATESVKIPRYGVEVPGGNVILGAGAGGYVAGHLGVPHAIGAAVGGAIPIMRGMVRGAREAMGPTPIELPPGGSFPEGYAATPAPAPSPVPATPAPATAIPEAAVDNRTMPQIAADEFAANRPPAEPPKVDPYDVAVGMGAKMSRKQYEGLPTDHPVRVNAEKTAGALDANAAKPLAETAPTVEEKSPPPATEAAPIADLPSMSKAKTPSDLAKAAGFPDGYVPTGKELAQAIHDSMAERGALPPENGATPSGAPDPTALADLMREVPNATRKPIADANYRAIKEGAAESETAAPVYESANRAIKVSPVAKALMDHGVTYSDLTSLSAKQIQAYVDQLSAATAAEGGAHPGHMFSKLSIEELLGEMRRAEKASK